MSFSNIFSVTFTPCYSFFLLPSHIYLLTLAKYDKKKNWKITVCVWGVGVKDVALRRL